jgi:hypothetical protein
MHDHGPVLGILVANAVSLAGLLLWGWSIWMAVAIYWLESALRLPVLAYRIRRAFPHLTAEQREAYLAARDLERTNGVSEGSRLRQVLASAGPERAGIVASRRFLTFYGMFALVQGVFVLGLGMGAQSIIEHRDLELDVAVFDPLALALAGLTILVAELVGSWLDPRLELPEVTAYTRRTLVLQVTIVIGAFVLTVAGATGLAVLFIALKTLDDLGLRKSLLARRERPEPEIRSRDAP